MILILLKWWYQLSYIDFDDPNYFNSDEDSDYDPDLDSYDYTDSEDDD